ncbi:signal peptidase I [Blautia sp. MSJ-19]|uniref:signal peptidase I n=1 Tax=Blautia sp. MSJ-19 TaxID=2841517 RepID=UPI001C0EED1B|nr:signal peptidase I [Blautia sp. MSJ-19]MBU5479804.1 signal peptidase I [Blautia sp. MSJ-19]
MRILRNFLIRLGMLILVLWLLFGVVFGITPMANADMSPAICAGDLMLYYRLDKNLKSQDVVVFQKDGRQYTGRIVAEGGDSVKVTDNAELEVNGSTLSERNIFYSTPAYDADVEYPLTLAEDQYFVLGDSREGAKDSRLFGAVREKEIKGKVITIIRRSEI